MSELNKKEIESHSSALFNKRIDFQWTVINQAEMDCLSATMPSVQITLAYYAPLMTMFNETAKMYETNDVLRKAIENCVKKSMNLVSYLKTEGAKQIGVETLLMTCLPCVRPPSEFKIMPYCILNYRLPSLAFLCYEFI